MRSCSTLRTQLGRALRQRTQKAKQRSVTSAPGSLGGGTATSPALSSSTSGNGDSSVAHVATESRPACAVDAELQRIMLGNVRDSGEVHAFRKAIVHADSKAAAAEAFLLLARLSNEALSPSTLKTVSSSLVERHAETLMSPAAYHAALSDAVGGADEANTRWQQTDPEERRCFAVHVCRELARRAERGTSFNKDVNLTIEGGDNEIVSLTEFHLRKALRQDKMLPAPTDVLVDLAHLDISWQIGLRLLEYARELRGNAVPTVEMNDRVMGLMTGYKTNGLGSRPWATALHLYQNALESGLDLTVTSHTHALDAVWRSADSFHKTHNTISDAHRAWILDKAVDVQSNVVRSGLEGRLAGEEGCAYMESLIKATSAAGSWETAVRLLLDMEVQPQHTSHRFLVPTPESYIFAIAACHAAGHAAHAEALEKMFYAAAHTLRSLHSEVLLIYLQSLRREVRTNPRIGPLVEGLLTDGHGLDRPCAVACLQLLSSPQVATTRAKTELAKAAFDLYDANVWIQQPLARKVELQTVFRCCHLIDARESLGRANRSTAGQRRGDGVAVSHVRACLLSVFGPRSAEIEWLDDTEVYALMVTTDVNEALAIYARQVPQRPLEKVKFLPMPVREVKLLLARALLRCCQIKMEARDSSESFALEEEDFHHDTQKELAALLEQCVRTFRTVFAQDASMPREVLAELLLMQATTTANYQLRKQLATEALQHLSLGSAGQISTAVLHRISESLSLTTLHVETTVIEEHAKLRAKTLTELLGEATQLEDIVAREYL